MQHQTFYVANAYLEKHPPVSIPNDDTMGMHTTVGLLIVILCLKN